MAPQELATLYSQLKTEFSKPSPDLATCGDLLSKLKVFGNYVQNILMHSKRLKKRSRAHCIMGIRSVSFGLVYTYHKANIISRTLS